MSTVEKEKPARRWTQKSDTLWLAEEEVLNLEEHSGFGIRLMPRVAAVQAAVAFENGVYISRVHLDGHPDPFLGEPTTFNNLEDAQADAELFAICVLYEEIERLGTREAYLKALVEHLLCHKSVEAGKCVLRSGHSGECTRYIGP